VFVGNSILGRGVRIGSGAIVANRRFDQDTIRLGSSKIGVSSGSEFAGAIIGDYCRLGANAVSNPGTLIGPFTWINALVNCYGFIPRAKMVSAISELAMTDKSAIPLQSGDRCYEKT